MRVENIDPHIRTGHNWQQSGTAVERVVVSWVSILLLLSVDTNLVQRTTTEGALESRWPGSLSDISLIAYASASLGKVVEVLDDTPTGDYRHCTWPHASLIAQ